MPMLIPFDKHVGLDLHDIDISDVHRQIKVHNLVDAMSQSKTGQLASTYPSKNPVVR